MESFLSHLDPTELAPPAIGIIIEAYLDTLQLRHLAWWASVQTEVFIFERTLPMLDSMLDFHQECSKEFYQEVLW